MYTRAGHYIIGSIPLKKSQNECMQYSHSLAICSACNWTLVMKLDYLLFSESNVAPSLAITPNMLLTAQSIDGTPIRSFVMAGGSGRERRRCRRWAG